MEHTNSSQRKNLLDVLRAIDFALYETVLYLDAYPTSKEALSHYNTLLEDRKAVNEEYRKKFGPLTVYENGGGEWKWIDGPWPWEPDAN